MRIPFQVRLWAAIAVGWLSLSAPVAADDLDTLFNRYLASFRADTRTLSETDARALMASLRADGTWPDVDLTVTDAVKWSPTTHLDRIAQLAKVYLTAGHALEGNAEVASKSSLALDAWIRVDPKSTNWWQNQIGALLSLGPCEYLMKDRLSAAQRIGTDSLMARAWKSKNRTGENLVWVSRITLWRAVFNRDTALASQAVAAIVSTISISTGDGLQRDDSFYQHGAQLYNGGYGFGFATDGADLAMDLRGTRFAFDKSALDLLAGYFLSGQRWMIRGSSFDHSARGREITRAGSGSAGGIGAAAANLAALVPASATDLDALAANIQNRAGSSVDGNRWFWRSEYMAQHRKGYAITLRMASQRVLASEVVNNEGLLSQYLADGTTFIYRTGKEYDAVFPVWDWCRVPGTTASHAGAPPAMVNPAPGSGDFAGGVSDGTFGAAAFEYTKLGVKAHKAWFFFDREMVALGSDVAADSDTIQTSINQSLLNGPVTCARGSADSPIIAVLPPGAVLPANPLWLHHDGIGYLFPGAAAGFPVVGLATGTVSGNWRRINAAQSADNVDKDVFDLWLDHGKTPAAGRYQYTVVPDIDVAAMAAYARQPPVAVLANRSDLQAVRHAGLGIAAAIFHQSGTLSLDAGLVVSPNRACLLLIRTETDRLVLAASDPRQGTADLLVKISAKLTGPGAVWSDADKATTVTLPLPKGDSAGATVLRAFSAPGLAVPSTPPPGGLSVSAVRAGNGFTVFFRLPGPGKARLSLTDPQGRKVADLFAGKLAVGAHSWKPVDALPEIGKASSLFVRLEWQGRSLVSPLRPGI